MKCKNILIFSFLKGGGDSGDAEVRQGAMALAKKQMKRIRAGAAKGIQVTNVVGPIAADRFFKDHAPLSTYEEKDDVGVYMICHATANSMTPTAEQLAAAMWEKLFLKNIDVKKINLVACLGAGQNGGARKDLDGSHLTKFCMELLKLDQAQTADARKLPDGLKVCGYAKTVTIVAKKGDNPWQPFGSVRASPVQRPHEEEWHAGGELQRKAFVKFNQGPNTVSSTHPKGAELVLAGQQLTALEDGPKKKQAQKIQQITGGNKPEALNALWSYLRSKRALKFNIATHTFDFCSMSEYTQNTDLGNLIGRLEQYLDPCEKQRSYRVVAPPVAAVSAVAEVDMNVEFDMAELGGGV